MAWASKNVQNIHLKNQNNQNAWFKYSISSNSTGLHSSPIQSNQVAHDAGKLKGASCSWWNSAWNPRLRWSLDLPQGTRPIRSKANEIYQSNEIKLYFGPRKPRKKRSLFLVHIFHTGTYASWGPSRDLATDSTGHKQFQVASIFFKMTPHCSSYFTTKSNTIFEIPDGTEASLTIHPQQVAKVQVDPGFLQLLPAASPREHLQMSTLPEFFHGSLTEWRWQPR